MAPEIINGQGHSAPVDWWSFGILIYELVYGITPFRGARRDEMFENVVKAPLRFPSKPTVSPECQALISALLVKVRLIAHKHMHARMHTRTRTLCMQPFVRVLVAWHLLNP